MFKNIDQTNIVRSDLSPLHRRYLTEFLKNNAYVSGMQEDLKLYGNELNYFTTFFK